MGWGALQLMTDDDRDPAEILAGFSADCATVQIEHQYPEPVDVYAYGYELMADCGLTMYCSECGTLMCPGCGSQPFVIVTIDEGAAAYCRQSGCRAARDRLLREFWPTVRFANLKA